MNDIQLLTDELIKFRDARHWDQFHNTKDATLRKDPSNFETYMKNVYRVLLTRGMRGCYVYFTDKQTEEYFRERMEIKYS